MDLPTQTCSRSLAVGLEHWIPVDDPVMGGVSQSEWHFQNGHGIFQGDVSLENQGGFCSVRSPNLHLGTLKAEGVQIRFRGDGQRYSIGFHCHGYGPGTSYRCKFETHSNTWQERFFPWDVFVLMRFGARVGFLPIDPNQIESLSLLIADKQAGPFRLEIAEMQFVSPMGFDSE